MSPLARKVWSSYWLLITHRSRTSCSVGTPRMLTLSAESVSASLTLCMEAVHLGVAAGMEQMLDHGEANAGSVVSDNVWRARHCRPSLFWNAWKRMALHSIDQRRCCKSRQDTNNGGLYSVETRTPSSMPTGYSYDTSLCTNSVADVVLHSEW
jgi:hypothetical protein